jgi:hypothetical protein
MGEGSWHTISAPVDCHRVTVFVFAQLAPDFDGQILKGTFAGWLIGRADWPRDDDRPLVRFVIEFTLGSPATWPQRDGKLGGVRL